jgi:hypothetical protein
LEIFETKVLYNPPKKIHFQNDIKDSFLPKQKKKTKNPKVPFRIKNGNNTGPNPEKEMSQLNRRILSVNFKCDNRVICKVTLSLGLLSPPIPSFTGIRKVRKIYQISV